MGSYSDFSSDLDEELPVFDFLSQTSQKLTERRADLVNLVDCDAEERASSFPASAKGDAGTADVMMISSDSDDDVPYVPLAQRLKQRQDNVITASSAATNGKDAEQGPPSNQARSQLSCQVGLPESELLLSVHQVRTGSQAGSNSSEEAASLQRFLLPKTVSGTESSDASSAKRKPAKRTAEEIQASREEALRRRQAKDIQQQDKEALRLEQERQKAQKKALAEAAKALRPEECIKHMVVAVDPGKKQSREKKDETLLGSER